MKVVIFCGGQGLRFANSTVDVPKVLAPIGDRPILWHLMTFYARYGHADFILCLGDRGDEIRSAFSKASGFRIDFAETGDHTPTGGRLHQVADRLKGERFLATYGDGLSDVDVDHLVQDHERSGRLATLTSVRPSSQYGVLEIDPTETVRAFAEKPRLPFWINAGFFVFEPQVLDLLDPDKDLETGLLERLTSMGELHAHRHEGFWKSMDTFKENREFNSMWESGRCPWRMT